MKRNTKKSEAANRNNAVRKNMPEENKKWFEEFKKGDANRELQKKPVAYFCAEYALFPELSTYAGGLGVLAGDYVLEAVKASLPVLAIGLLYKKTQSGKLEESDMKFLKPVTDQEGKEVTVSMPLASKNVGARAWLWEQGSVKLYLLDTDLPSNSPEDRKITEELYVEDRDLRLKQEILLGILGFRLLAKLGYHASAYHLNEGHSAFLALELVRHEMEHQKVNFVEACEFAKKHVVFTNHTLVPAGQEQFASARVSELIELCALEICLNNFEIVGLGTLPENPDTFSMTTMSFRLSSKSTSVSKLHLEKAKEIWSEHAATMQNVTNGISVERWDKIDSAQEQNIWARHLQNKKRLIELVKDRTGKVWNENDLILVWARRLVGYKQPLFFFDSTEELKKIIENSPVKVRILVSGRTGSYGASFASTLEKLAIEELKDSLAFIPNYDLELAEILVAGADVWLNTPIPGNEACGTSGMKAALNGGLGLSTRDGWVGEVTEEDFGWVVQNYQSGEEMRSVLEKEIIPLYTTHLEHPEDSGWVKRMLRARAMIIKNFSAARMLREYIEKLYLPTMAQKHEHKID